MKKLQWISGIAGSIAFLFVLLITSFELGAYSNFGFYEREYGKYQVQDAVRMDMEDIMYVTREMMDYLKGKRDDLVVQTTVDGAEREFFNDREKAHMEDVKNLFLGGIFLRRIALIVTALAFGILIALRGKWKQILPKAYLAGTAVFFGAVCILGGIIASDFSKYFTIFHEIFFDNDLWLLNPATDLMINMLPEGFFMDMTLRIALIFLYMLVLSLGLSIFCIKRINKKN